MTPKFELGQDFCTVHLPPSFIILCVLVWKLSCWHTNKQTNRHRWKHPMLFATLQHWVISFEGIMLRISGSQRWDREVKKLIDSSWEVGYVVFRRLLYCYAASLLLFKITRCRPVHQTFCDITDTEPRKWSLLLVEVKVEVRHSRAVRIVSEILKLLRRSSAAQHICQIIRK